MDTLSPLQSLFGKSPFKALQQHMRKVNECAEQLPTLIDAVVAGDRNQVQAIATRIQELEKEAETMENDLFLHLPKSLFMAVDRRDLLVILDFNDEVADECLRLANRLLVAQHPPSTAVGEELKDATRKCLHVVQQSKRIMEEMDELVETGFAGREAKLVMGLIEELGAARKDAEGTMQRLAGRLFEVEGAVAPLAVIYWSQVLDELSRIPAAADKAGSRVRLLLAR
ncbi:MAG: DUF47 family protein [Magnetococcales bacterium]|nr:DUF47 family protein [Magnetococcales bacterium]